jgi:hypothetical protein
MRIIKLSGSDKEIAETGIEEFFTKRLKDKLPCGKFEITKKIRSDGISKGELLVFSFKGDLVYFALAASARLDNKNPECPDYPYFFLVDVPSIVRASGTLSELQDWLRKENLHHKRINGPRVWNEIDEKDDFRREKLTKILGYFSDQALGRLNTLTNMQVGKVRAVSKKGGLSRQSNPMLRSEVEKIAIKETTIRFEKDYSVESCEKDNVGWDLLATSRTEELRLEVKGLTGNQICVELTPNEYAQMQKWRDSYRICVVTNAMVEPRLAIFRYYFESNKWQDDQGNSLQVEEAIAARCRVK